MRKQLLVIEDEPAIVDFLRSALHGPEWNVLAARTGTLGLDLAATHQPDAILLDLCLREDDPVEMIRSLRDWTATPILLMATQSKNVDAALRAGADDYLVKPFEISELKTRLRLALSHQDRRLSELLPVYCFQGLKVDLFSRRVWLDDCELHLSPMQYRLLSALVRHAGRTLSSRLLIKEVWGHTQNVTVDALRVFVMQLRRKIEANPTSPCFIKTETGYGYRLEAPAQAALAVGAR